MRIISLALLAATVAILSACARAPQRDEAAHHAASAAPAHAPGATTPAASHSTSTADAAAAGGVVGLDAVASGDVADLLLAEASGAGVRLLHRRSRDGGASWSEAIEVPAGDFPVAPVHRGADPQIAAAGDRLLVAWTARGSSPWGTGPIGAAASPDGGRTWTAAAPPADDRSTDGHGFLDLAAGPDRSIHAVWLDSRDGAGQGLRHASSRDGGRSWSPNATIDARTCECCWNRIRADGEELLVLYRDLDPRDLRLAKSGDGGASWRDLGRPGRFDWDFDGCPHVGGALVRSRDAIIALDWTGAADRAGLFVSTLPGGETWSAPRRLGGAGARNADLASLGDGLVAVWDEASDGNTALWSSLSRDQGATWSPAESIATAGHPSHPLVVSTAEGALVLWTESRDSGPATWASLRLPLD